MWQPEKKDALPSPGDFKHAKKVIDELEDALKDALAVLEQAQSRVLALTKELEERKAWIAPIRKLPSELLSEIFIFGSEMEHLAPVIITEVSKLWRAIVLATPRAWSLIYANAPERVHHLDQYISTFTKRSKPCLLHIWIQEHLDYDADDDRFKFEPLSDRILTLFWASLSRVQCLSISRWHLGQLRGKYMPNVTRLTIMESAREIPPFFISHDQFPRLQSIQSTGDSWRDSVSLAPFLPLQELVIRISDRSAWSGVVKNCSTTLKSLTIVGKLIWREHATIILPCLQSLTLSEWSGNPEPAEWSITMVTPGLISYSESSPGSAASRLLHGDVRSVAYLRSSHIPDLSPYTGLHVLQLLPSYAPTYLALAAALTEQLQRDINTSPALELVEFRLSLTSEKHPELESTKRDIIEQIKSARSGIKVSFTGRFSPMPGSMEENSCNPSMPCSQELV